MDLLIEPARGESDLRVVAGLFRDYAASLPVSLDYQDFEVELASLPGKYASPRGDLLMARDRQGAVAGCVGLRPLSDTRCEMKRLYVVPAARGGGAGSAIAEAAISAARRMGYRELCLDTLPSMTSAAALYRRLGFRPVAPYYGPTPPGTLFMALPL